MFYFSHKTTCTLSTSVQPDSMGNLKFSIEHKLYPESKGTVLYNGSACGVDLNKYNIHRRADWRKEIFDQYNLAGYKMIYGFVGRVVVEKGINELLTAFMKMNKPDTCLMMVGPLDDVINTAFSGASAIKFPKIPNAAKYYAAFDYMMLPSYQEGFGMSVLEAAAEGTPSIISDIKGPTELIEDGFNGLICSVKSVDSLCDVMQKAYNMSKEEYDVMALNSYEKAARDFDDREFKRIFLENRNSLLNEHNKKLNK